MQYTVVLTPKTDGGLFVSAPLLPNWRVEAKTRAEAISLARTVLAEFIKQSEILAIDLPENGRNGQDEPPWEWFGAGKNDPSWDELFDEIERRRDDTLETGQ